ncbi:MAG TPA: hypothetical protein VLA19_02220 [Herpetosiphonaceae bacterium]|nr:hypothetical protein [Herpetosiphonaceae bacterium]
MARDFAAEISSAEAQLQATLQHMKEVQHEFVAAATEFLASWYWSETESTVKRDPELSRRLGVAKLSQLKAEVKGLQDNAAMIAAEFLDQDDLWWHRHRGEHMYYYYHGNRPPDILDKPLRLAAGRLAPILETYGYLKPTISNQQTSVWREWDRSGNYHPAGARPYYPYGLGWPKPMAEMVKQYSELQQQGQTQESELKRLENEKDQNEVQDLWDKA